MKRLPDFRQSRAFFKKTAFAFLVVANFSAAHAAPPADANLQTTRERLDVIRDVYNSTETSLKQPSQRDRDLTVLRDTINPLRDEIRTIIGQLEPRYTDTQKRLKELGTAPAENAAPEDARITIERDGLNNLSSELDSVLKQARLLNVRGDQLTENIDTTRRSLFTERLLTRGDSILSPSLWIPAFKALPEEAQNFFILMKEWNAYAEEGTSTGTIVLAPLSILALVVAVFFLRKMLLRRIDKSVAKGEMLQNRRSRAAYLTICRTVIDAVTPLLIAFAAFDILSAFDLVSPRIDQLSDGLLVAVGLFSVGCAVTRAMVEPARKMLSLDESSAQRLYNSVVGAITVVAAATLIFAFHRVLGAPSSVRTATAAMMSLFVGLFIARILLTRGIDEKTTGIPNFIRFLGWIACIAVFLALITGHINFASFIAARLVDATIIGGAAVLLLSLTDSIFAAGFSEEGSSRRRVAAAIGVNPARLDLLATIIGGLLRALLLLVAAFLIVGGWRSSVTDVASTLNRFDLVFEIGQSRVALGNILVGVAVFVIGLIATRIVHRWLTSSVLPRAGLDTGLQNSIATMAVYLGVIVAALLSLGQIGINLQNIALVAGALSVGIGFGLQSVVSNFVSGIILLAERPIRVGDIIDVKGQSGYVRRISVRATEIETADKANVIVPNSDLISNVVTNWTHANTLGRIKLKVGVSYDSDPHKIRDILLAAADKHQQVVKAPAPAVLLLGFGDYALEFELLCVVGNVDTSGTVKSDLYFEILREFRAARIEIPFPQQEYRLRSEGERHFLSGEQRAGNDKD